MSRKIIENYKNRRRDEQPEISEAEHRANCDSVVEMLLNVMERLPENLPNDSGETIDDLLGQLETGVKSPPVIVNHLTGSRVRYFEDGTKEILDESASAPAVDSARIGEADASKTDALQPPELTEEVINIAEVVREKNFRR